jgi:hypothetical protein
MTPSWFIVKNAVPTTTATDNVLFRCRGVRATATSSRNVDHVGAELVDAKSVGAEFFGVVFISASDDQRDVVDGRPRLPQIPPYRYGT